MNLSIQNALVELQSIHSSQKVTKELEQALSSATELSSKLRNFTLFAERGSEKTFSKVELKTAAERVITALKEKAEWVGVTLEVEDLDKVPTLYWDDEDIEQVFLILLTNAIEAAQGLEERRVIIRAVSKNTRVELQFADDCRGIAPEHVDKVFEPFFTTKPEGQGTGLGLCLLKRVVEQAGGKVRVESKYGEGSTFFVDLPIETKRPKDM